MTQPSLHTTFDTSLIDLGTAGDSFSTTESMPSEKDAQRPSETTYPNQDQVLSNTGIEHEPMATDSKPFAEASTATAKVPVKYVPTVSAHDSWMSVYDTDGNILQATDDMELETLLPKFLSLVEPASPGADVHIVDLGCGTGRNTLKLIQDPTTQRRVILGIDASPEMLALADQKLSTLVASREKDGTTYSLLQHGFLNSDHPNAAPNLLDLAQSHDALLATLILEHFPLKPFFVTVRSLIRPGGVVLLTNIHPDLGSISQAGFVSADGNGHAIKIRGTSWAHGVEETAAAAKNAGFRVLGDILEGAVTEDMLPVLGARGRKWIGVKVWYGMILVRED